MPHLIVAPVALPLFTAAVLLLVGESHRQWKALIDIAACALGLVVAVALMHGSSAMRETSAVAVYLPSNWQAPFGIVLVVDRLSALMLVLTGVVSLASVLFATARWHRAGVHFHALFQLQLMGAQRRVPDRRPLQPVRVLRGDAGRVVRAAAARLGPARACAPGCTTSPSTCSRRRCS